MKAKQSKLDPFAERLTEWFSAPPPAGKTLAEAKEALAADGCEVSLGRLSEWWQSRQAEMQEERLLSQITSGAKQCREVEKAFGDAPAPEFETLIKLHRVLILKLSTAGNAEPELLELVNRMMKPVVQFARLQQLAEQNKIEERKLVLLEKKAELADKAKGLLGDKALTEEERAGRMRELFGM